MKHAAALIPARGPGRPPRITLDALIDAACELGLDSVEMTAVAERLGVAVATLYRYVQDRDHLLRLVVQRCSLRDRVVDRGQSWQEALREHAKLAFNVYRAWPQLVGHITTAGLDDLADTQAADELIGLLVERGFPARSALSAYIEVGQVVIGAAVGFAYNEGLRRRAGSYAARVEKVVARHGQDQLRMLRRSLESGADPDVLGDYRPTLERLITAYEAQLARSADEA